jgi:hypothetical protein
MPSVRPATGCRCHFLRLPKRDGVIGRHNRLAGHGARDELCTARLKSLVCIDDSRGMKRCAFVGLLALAACSFGPGITDEIRGRVVDRETGASVAGAEVFAVWFHVTVGSERAVFAQWATSDADGGFVIPSRVAIRAGLPLPLESSGGPPRLAVYHPEFALQFFDPSDRSERILDLERPESMRDWRAAVWRTCSTWRAEGSCRLHDGCEHSQGLPAPTRAAA